MSFSGNHLGPGEVLGKGFVRHKPKTCLARWLEGAEIGGMPMFTQGEIIVRDDLKYPDGAVGVDSVDERGC